MSKRFLTIVLALLAFGVQAFSQATVSGKVTDAQGEAVVGASVLVKGTKTGTMTNLDGAYSLANVPANATLVFSCVGFADQEVVVGSRQTINVVLAEDSEFLDDVVVVAYGTAKRRDLTGSIATVDGGDIAVQAQGSVTRALEGQVAGLQTGANDGQPGWDMGIRVRGMGTANVNYSNALVIIDGVPAYDANPLSGLNPLSSINSKDIESITVLKDAASTALYGSRGANGVVLITTKSGKKGKTKISFEARVGLNTVGANGLFDKVGDKNLGDIYEAYWQGIYNAAYYGKTQGGESLKGNAAKAAEFASQHLFNYTGSATNFAVNALGNKMAYNVPGAVYTTTGEGTKASATMTGAYLVNTDGKLNPNAELIWNDGYSIADVLITNRMRQEYNVSASGASDKVDYHMSLGYLSDPSYVSTSRFDRITARGTVNAQITDWLKAGVKFSYTHRKSNAAEYRWAGRNSGTVGDNPFYWVHSTSALDQVYARDNKGNILTNADGTNLVAVMQSNLSVIHSAVSYSPLGVYQAPASYNLPEMFNQLLHSSTYDDLDAKGYVRASFLKYFTAEANISYNIINGIQTRFYNAETAGPRYGLTNSGSAIQKIYRHYNTINTQQLVNYNQDIDKHHVDALVGHEFNEYNSDGLNYGSSYALLNGFTGYANFLGNNAVSRYLGTTYGGTNLDKVALESYFARANYIYADKYYVSASLRRDGSSKFKKPENRWGTFWSIGGGWRISEEAFMESTKDWLNNLKVRASYGVIGNQNGISNYSGYQTWSYSAAKWKQNGDKIEPDGTTLSRGAEINDSLTWEKVNTLDAGVDFTLFGGKIAGSLDWYNKATNNAIFGQYVSYLAAGQNTQTKNTLGLRTRGIELDLSYQPVKTKDWDVIISTNGTHYNTIITKVPTGYGSAALNGCNIESPTGWTVGGTGADVPNGFLRGVGKDYYNLYIYRYAGVAGNTGISYYGTDGKLHTGYTKGDVDAGNPLFYHKVVEGETGKYPGANVGDDVRVATPNQASKYELGSVTPKWIGGFSFKVRYKSVDLSAMFGYQLGGKFFSVDYGSGEVGKLGASNMLTQGAPFATEVYGNTWSEDNLDAKYPMMYYGGDGVQGGTTISGQNYTDLAAFSASYLSLKNVTLGYTFPASLLNRAKISNLRVYVSADNSFMLYAHSGVDPRRSLVGGLDLGACGYPALAVYNFGVNLDF